MEYEADARSSATIRLVIPTFSMLMHRISSRITYIQNLPWNIMAVPRTIYGPNTRPTRCLGFFLRCNLNSDSLKKSCKATAYLKLISQKGKKNFCRKIEHNFFGKEKDWGFAGFMHWDNVLDPENGFIKDDTIILEAIVIADPQWGVRAPSISEDMKTLYLDPLLTDVILKTETKSFPAHKIVLCARSPVFKAMLTNDMIEKSNNCIQVNDLEDDAMQRLLLFLYSDQIEDLHWNSAIQLYYAADKYQISKLKEFCSSFLVENLTITNAAELLHLTDSHNDTDLRKIVKNFILDHEQQVFATKDWEILMETDPQLVMKTMVEI